MISLNQKTRSCLARNYLLELLQMFIQDCLTILDGTGTGMHPRKILMDLICLHLEEWNFRESQAPFHGIPPPEILTRLLLIGLEVVLEMVLINQARLDHMAVLA